MSFLDGHRFSAFQWTIFGLCFLIVLAAGALSSGPLADWLGRKKLLVSAVLVFGVACLASSLSDSLGQLTTLRFLTGLGLGAAMPNAVTLMSEYCPDRLREGRATGVAWMLGFGRFGGIAGSFLVAELSRRQFTFAGIFTVVAVPGLVAAAALLVKQWANPEPAAGTASRVRGVAAH